jgi:hypothetical protein
MNADGFSSFLVRLAENIISSPDAPAECGFIIHGKQYGIIQPVFTLRKFVLSASFKEIILQVSTFSSLLDMARWHMIRSPALLNGLVS